MNTSTDQTVKLTASNQKYGDSTTPWIARITGGNVTFGVALAFLETGRSTHRHAFVREGLFRTRNIDKKGRVENTDYAIWQLGSRLILTAITERQAVEWCELPQSEIARLAACEELRDRQAAQIESQAKPQDEYVRVDEHSARELGLPEGHGKVTRREFCEARALMIASIEALLSAPVTALDRRAEIHARLDELRLEQLRLERELAEL